MKIAWIKYFPLVVGLMLFIACNNNTKTTDAGNTNPIFQNDPKLKSITDEIIKTPKDAALYFNRGRMLHKMQMDSLALHDFKKASSLDSNKAEYLSAVGDLLFESKDITGSIEWIQKAIIKNPEDRKAHLKIAKLFLILKDYTRALGEVNLVMRKNVYDPEAYFLKGMVYKDMKDTAKAISSFQTAVQVAPDYRDAVIQLGMLYTAKDDAVGVKYLENAYVMDSTDVFPLYALGMYYQGKKDYPRAKEEYRKCIIRDRHYADALFNMGFILMQQDSPAKAYRQYDLVIKIDPLNPSAYYNRGICSEMLDSPKNAIADYEQSIRLDTGYASPKEALKRLKKK
jgi:tetratricopeptide (TPR) repeat protein